MILRLYLDYALRKYRAKEKGLRRIRRKGEKKSDYGVATNSRLVKITGLFCRISSLS